MLPKSPTLPIRVKDHAARAERQCLSRNDGPDPEGGSGHCEYLSEIDGLERIRYMTSSRMSSRADRSMPSPKLVSQLHLPVSRVGPDSGGNEAWPYASNTIDRAPAAAARRSHRFPSTSSLGSRVKRKRFEQTMKLIRMSALTAVSFVYSPRPGTPAADFADRFRPRLHRRRRMPQARSRNNLRPTASAWSEKPNACW